MISVFYIAQILSTICGLALLGFCASFIVLGVNLLLGYLDPETKANKKKSNRIALIGLITSFLIFGFVPDGKTYLKMKFGEERLEVLMNVIDDKILNTIEETELIDYE